MGDTLALVDTRLWCLPPLSIVIASILTGALKVKQLTWGHTAPEVGLESDLVPGSRDSASTSKLYRQLKTRFGGRDPGHLRDSGEGRPGPQDGSQFVEVSVYGWLAPRQDSREESLAEEKLLTAWRRKQRGEGRAGEGDTPFQVMPM